MAGSDIGDDHKEYFAGEAALKAGGAHNTMGQFHHEEDDKSTSISDLKHKAGPTAVAAE